MLELATVQWVACGLMSSSFIYNKSSLLDVTFIYLFLPNEYDKFIQYDEFYWVKLWVMYSAEL